jgi:hypothetical protein
MSLENHAESKHYSMLTIETADDDDVVVAVVVVVDVLMIMKH